MSFSAICCHLFVIVGYGITPSTYYAIEWQFFHNLYDPAKKDSQRRTYDVQCIIEINSVYMRMWLAVLNC